VPSYGADIILHEGMLFSVGLETIISPHVDTSLFPWKNFTPSLHRPSALPLKSIWDTGIGGREKQPPGAYSRRSAGNGN